MTKYVNDNGVSEMWTNTKNYISAQLLGKSDVGHTHSASDITSGLATVATSGSYNDLSNKPTIPSKTSDLTNDSGFITEDTTKIPLAGSNAISGDLIPATDNSIDVGSSTNRIKMLYTKGITINGTQFLPSDYIPRSGGAVITGTEFFKTSNGSSLKLCAGNAWNNGGGVVLWGKDSLSLPGGVTLKASNGTNYTSFDIYPSGGVTLNNNGTTKNLAMAEDVVPRSGGVVLTGGTFARNVDNGSLLLIGGSAYNLGAYLELYGKNNSNRPGQITLTCRKSDGTSISLILQPNGTATWGGQSIQTTSDKRLKQQISEIDNALLDAWEDVELSQFKYNDAVKEKSDNARLHTGYVVQQIDEACKSHGVDVSKYGLYCHEVYQEETREVENDDGTKTVEVVRPANEHYSLRYTEALIVECAYLRKCIKELRNEIEQLKSSK